MNQRLAIGGRLKELRKRKKYSQEFVAKNLFISQAAYSLIESSQNGIVAEHIVKLSDLFQVTTDYILKGDDTLIRISPSSGFIPYIEIKAHASYVKNKKGDLSAEGYEWFRIPGYNPSKDHRLFEIDGESMAPTVFPNDIVIVQKQNNWDHILDGSLVIVATKKSLLAKRFKKGRNPDSFHFENDNPEEVEVLEFSKDDIQEILIVRGKITNILFSPHHFASSDKIKSMEESIEFLKKELFIMSKKLASNRN